MKNLNSDAYLCRAAISERFLCSILRNNVEPNVRYVSCDRMPHRPQGLLYGGYLFEPISGNTEDRNFLMLNRKGVSVELGKKTKFGNFKLVAGGINFLRFKHLNEVMILYFLL